MKKLILALPLLALACSPESMLTPDECKVERVRKETTFTIGEAVTTESSYKVTMQDGRVFYITEEQALAAQADPVKACRELGAL